MPGWMARAGRRMGRPALLVAGLAAATGLVWLAAGRRQPAAARGPVAVPNAEAEPAVEFRVGSVRHIVSPEAPQRLLPDTGVPDGPVELLWLQGRAAAPLPEGGVLVPDGSGGLFRFDQHLALGEPVLLAGRELVSVAAARRALWASDEHGGLWRRSGGGAFRRVASVPFDFPAVAADPASDEVWLVRRPDRWNPRLPAPAPLVVQVDSTGAVRARVGRALVPAERWLVDFASAGQLAVAGDTIYYAPFIRDELIAFSARGDTLWVASRELPQSTREPRFVTTGAEVSLEYFPVNLGLRVGPDGRLYLLSTPGFTTEASRLDVFDRRSGRLLRSALLPTALPTVAVSREGRVYRLDPFRLLAAVPPGRRQRFGDFALERLGGGRMTLRDLEGKVVLVNFWASWCGPCRVELPALDTLQRQIGEPDFLLVTLNDDAVPGDAERFVRQLGVDLPVLLGRGRLKERYHYRGLPLTVLLDREGRVVQQWLGYAGARQLQAERALIRAELARPAPDSTPSAGQRHRH